MDDLIAHFVVDEVVTPQLAPRYNIAPSSPVYTIVGSRRGPRRLGVMTWGMVASWADDPASGPRPINARAETLLERPFFADAFRRRRCLLPVDGFFEWADRQPYLIAAADGSPLALAGIWDRWNGPQETVVSCAVVTTDANEAVAPLHDRMPALLPPQAWAAWLDPSNHDPFALGRLLRPSPASELSVHPVDRRVNNASNDGPELLVEATPGHEPMPLPGFG